MFGVKRTAKLAPLAASLPLAAAGQVAVAVRDGRAVLMDLNSGRYYGLDDVGTRIWELVLLHKTPQDIYEAVELEYDAPAQQLRDDASRFLASLLALGLICQ